MKIIHRVLELITNQNLNNSKFEKMNSISNGYLSKQLKNEGDIGEDILVRILENFREINTDWLILGEGPMYRPKIPEIDTTTISEPPLQYKNNETLTVLKTALEDKQIIIDLLQEKIKHLEQKLKSHKNESK